MSGTSKVFSASPEASKSMHTQTQTPTDAEKDTVTDTDKETDTEDREQHGARSKEEPEESYREDERDARMQEVLNGVWRKGWEKTLKVSTEDQNKEELATLKEQFALLGTEYVHTSMVGKAYRDIGPAKNKTKEVPRVHIKGLFLCQERLRGGEDWQDPALTQCQQCLLYTSDAAD